ncbi:MAG: hypothetical protein JW731_01805 [Bacteroidales bacterium]|nr:hypothetical protein [Bacteroidales bacterium]
MRKSTKYINYLILLWLMMTGMSGVSQEKKKLGFTGHLQNLNTVWIQDYSSQWLTSSSFYNRLNLKWYMHQNFTFSASARNVLNYGQLIYDYYPLYSDLLVEDNGFMDLTGTIARDSSYLLYSNIDRLNLKFTKGKFEATVGRQRINWGINMVWNPNDIFNTFNFYDFDYVERPGCDAIRLQYYTGYASGYQLAFKMDADEEITAAGMYSFNKWDYDFQVLGGVMTGDIVLGAGWSGYIKGAGFTGEASWFRDKDNFADTTGIWVISAGANYTFKNSLFAHISGLYTSNGTTGNAGQSGAFIVLQEVSPKTFTLARYSLMGELSYPITPLIRGDVATIVNPNDGSFFLGPNVGFSLTDNIGLLLMAQIFVGDTRTEFGGYGQLYYMRLKWSF